MFNLNSSQQLSRLFFGGVETTKENHPMLDELGNPIRLKTGVNRGQIKYKNIVVAKQIKGMGLIPSNDWKTKQEGIYSVNEAVLKQISQGSNPKAKHIAENILTLREKKKQISTYYESLKQFLYPEGFIHPEFSHCGYDKENHEVGGGTATGRLSARKPPVQTQPRAETSKVKQHFCSRYEGGYIIEFDYKGLEVYIFAFLTNDWQLLNDLENNIDIYLQAASVIFDCPYDQVTKEQRQIVKPAILAIIYGAGANRIAKTQQISKEFAKHIISTFYDRYPTAREWQNNLVEEVKATAVLTDEKTPAGFNKHRGQYKSITGRKYEFLTTDSPDFLKAEGIMTSFNPPDIKNYPVQGLATADIVLIMLGRFWREVIKHRDKFLLINTVHDSVIIDCKKEYVEFACNLGKSMLESVNKMMKEVFNIEFNLKLAVEIKLGHNWYDMREIK